MTQGADLEKLARKIAATFQQEGDWPWEYVMTEIQDFLASTARSPAVGEWLDISTAPKTGEEILVRFPRMQNVIILANWNKVHGYWQSKGKPQYFHEGDLWCNIPLWRKKQ